MGHRDTACISGIVPENTGRLAGLGQYPAHFVVNKNNVAILYTKEGKENGPLRLAISSKKSGTWVTFTIIIIIIIIDVYILM